MPPPPELSESIRRNNFAIAPIRLTFDVDPQPVVGLMTLLHLGGRASLVGSRLADHQS